jgi:hypothetical protein
MDTKARLKCLILLHIDSANFILPVCIAECNGYNLPNSYMVEATQSNCVTLDHNKIHTMSAHLKLAFVRRVANFSYGSSNC